MKHAIALSLILVLALPVSAVLTWMLGSFWDWFETCSGIESLGHSEPVEWCYIAVFIMVFSLGSGTWLLIRTGKQ